MIDFEDQLRNALARKEPPDGFTERVIARVERHRSRRSFWKPWAAGCLAASLLAGAWGLKEFEDRRNRERGQAARAQLLQALQITSSKLHRIQKKVEMVEQ
jgi:hypothetical protein